MSTWEVAFVNWVFLLSYQRSERRRSLNSTEYTDTSVSIGTNVENNKIFHVLIHNAFRPLS